MTVSQIAHADQHQAFAGASPFLPPANDLVRLKSRRWFLQTGLAGMAGLSLPALLQQQAQAAANGKPTSKKAVILFWLSGGPSHIDMWDPKPEAPQEIRSPFGTIGTKLPGVQFTEHLPLQAAMADKLSILRGVDCSASNHTPITMQAGNPLAQRTDNGRDGGGYPSMGSIAARFRGANDPEMPAFLALAPAWAADVYGAGDLGNKYEPLKGLELAGKFALPPGLEEARLGSREQLRRQFDRVRQEVDRTSSMQQFDRFTQQALDMVLSGKVQQALNLDAEKEATRSQYGGSRVGDKALLARRLVEAGVTFVVISGAWGYWDHHGDSVQWGGLEKGLRPILPEIDRALFALVNDLEQRGLLDSTLILMLGEFGRSPVINKDAGRDHWTSAMSMVLAGGNLRHGQVIGSTDSRGGAVASGMVRPQDLAASVFRHLEIDPATHWVNPQGRPVPIVAEGGKAIEELF